MTKTRSKSDQPLSVKLAQQGIATRADLREFQMAVESDVAAGCITREVGKIGSDIGRLLYRLAQLPPDMRLT